MKFYFELYCTVSKFNPSFLSDTTVLLNIFNPVNRCFCSNPFLSHCVKSVHIRSFFWSVFSRIQTEYKEILGISPHLVRMRENTDQKNSVFGHFSRSIINHDYFQRVFFRLYAALILLTKS